MPEIISRKEAIARGLKRYFTGSPCGNGHLAERLSFDGACVECEKNQRARGRARCAGLPTPFLRRGRRPGGPRDLAIAQGQNRYFTGVPCKFGHVCERTVAQRKCVDCEKSRKRNGRASIEQRREWARRWRAKNPKKGREYNKQYRKRHPTVVAAKMRRYRVERAPKYGQYQREYQRERYRKMAAAYRALRELGIEI